MALFEKYKVGDKRIVKRYIMIPKTLKGVTVQFRSVRIRQEYQVVGVNAMWGTDIKEWVDIEFVM